ncbi:MAG: 1-deoxy-D-xylulose-5-phosphate reductoisomerase [Candidatus Omnitrophica bacterium]|nr:1-deoxy-D-xylulose-5-phosphate reductoisomerase [Candidatus Omnitrophota bacterium]
MKNIAILGSTGSIGVNTLDVISRLKGRFRVVALSADSSIELLARQARVFHPKVVSVGNEELANKAKKLLPSRTRVVYGPSGLRFIAARPDIDIIVFAISGTTCLIPLLDAIDNRKEIALANKEALVSAGPLVMSLAAKRGVRILPIDSEHSAIFQCINGKSEAVSRIYLTGSGGPLLDVKREKFGSLPLSYILKHPRWKMGKKITVDSATMMNKGLEIIEAKYLFNIKESSIEVLVHPEAIVHSMVEFTDSAVIAQLGVPDMRLPIEYALTFPERSKAIVKRVDFPGVGALTFRKPDSGKFPCLALARDAAASGRLAPAVLCASDEEAVKNYLNGNITFTDIPKIIEKVLERHKNTVRSISVKHVMDADSWAREETERLCYR